MKHETRQNVIASTSLFASILFSLNRTIRYSVALSIMGRRAKKAAVSLRKHKTTIRQRLRWFSFFFWYVAADVVSVVPHFFIFHFPQIIPILLSTNNSLFRAFCLSAGPNEEASNIGQAIQVPLLRQRGYSGM
jgi:hypothetical protein